MIPADPVGSRHRKEQAFRLTEPMVDFFGYPLTVTVKNPMN